MSPPGSRHDWVLCVDDNEDALSVRAALLEEEGFRVSVLTSELEVMSFLDANKVDAVILDYLMPDIMGDRLASIIRNAHPELPIVLISGAVDDLREIGGADVFVSKSDGFRRLVEVLSRLLVSSPGAAA